jgi:hypothetical protein
MKYNAKDGIELLRLINLNLEKNLESKFIEEYENSNFILSEFKMNEFDRHIVNVGYAYTEVYSTGDEHFDDIIFQDYLTNAYFVLLGNNYNKKLIN